MDGVRPYNTCDLSTERARVYDYGVAQSFAFLKKKYSIKEGREDFFEDEQVRLKVNPSHS